MIDVHSHIIFGVDDGSPDLDTSISMVKEMINIGVTDVICTPHYRINMFETSTQTIKNNFNLLVSKINELGLNINLYLGREVYYNKNIYNCLDDFKINNQKIILIEFSYSNNPDIEEVLYNLKRLGFKVIIAHIERYSYLNVDDIKQLKSKNVLIQVNADTILGKSGFRQKLKVMHLIKNNVIDFIASDIHSERNNYMEKAYNIIKKKFGAEKANQLFVLNAKTLLNNNGE